MIVVNHRESLQLPLAETVKTSVMPLQMGVSSFCCRGSPRKQLRAIFGSLFEFVPALLLKAATRTVPAAPLPQPLLCKLLEPVPIFGKRLLFGDFLDVSGFAV